MLDYVGSNDGTLQFNNVGAVALGNCLGFLRGWSCNKGSTDDGSENTALMKQSGKFWLE